MWGHTDSNREPSSYEPPALTVELCPLKMTNGHFEEKTKYLPLAYDSLIIAAFPLEASSDVELQLPPPPPTQAAMFQ